MKSVQLSLIALICLFYFSATAQKISQADSIQNSYVTKQAKTFFFELLGPGAVYSVNYDIRFNKRQDGWGGRAGISYYADDSEHIFTVPVVINYLAGKRGKYFEVGAGITYYNANTGDVFFSEQYNVDYSNGGTVYYKRSNQNGVLGTLNFGYRYQPIDGGFSFRGGVSPIFSSSQFTPFWPYISFGYAF
jgi:hypothetical protein